MKPSGSSALGSLGSVPTTLPSCQTQRRVLVQAAYWKAQYRLPAGAAASDQLRPCRGVVVYMPEIGRGLIDIKQIAKASDKQRR
jgi:hypothetical protein